LGARCLDAEGRRLRPVDIRETIRPCQRTDFQKLARLREDFWIRS
jgi:hypothetical protein